MIYSRDHAPAHVHIVGPNGRAKVALTCPDSPAVPIDARGIDARTLKRMLELIESELSALCRNWSEIHGAT